jgi:hypothetical protein
MRIPRLVPIIIELLGIVGIGIGTGIELTMHADIGYIALSIGSVLIATGGIVYGKFTRKGN